MIAKSYGVPTGLGPDVCIPLQPCGQTEGDLHWQITRRVGEAEGICKTAHSDVGGGKRISVCYMFIFGWEGEEALFGDAGKDV